MRSFVRAVRNCIRERLPPGCRGALFRILAVAVAAVSLWVIPLPYYIITPGDAHAAKALVRVQDARPGPRGEFLVLTVSIRRANLFWWLYGQLEQDKVQLQRRAEFLGPYPDYAAYESVTRQMMDQSQQDAAAAALRALGYAVPVEHLGVRIQVVLADSPAAAALQPGDLITAVDGHPVHTSTQLVDTLRTLDPPRPVRLTVRRGDQELQPMVPTVPQGDRRGARLGVLVENAYRMELPVTLEIDPMQITGPSAGLTFALEILEQLTAEDLGRSRVVAATGSVDPAGQVGEIGSLPLKVLAAEAAGAEVIFVPAAQAAVAQRVARTVQVVPVATVSQALDWLRSRGRASSAGIAVPCIHPGYALTMVRADSYNTSCA